MVDKHLPDFSIEVPVEDDQSILVPSFHRQLVSQLSSKRKNRAQEGTEPNIHGLDTYRRFLRLALKSIRP